MRVRCEVSETTLENENGQEVEGVEAVCSRCGIVTESFGTTDASVRRCLALLREGCPRAERNYYIAAGDEAPPVHQPASLQTPAVRASIPVMPFGVHAGEPLDNVPYKYLEWMIKELHNIRPELREAIIEQLEFEKVSGTKPIAQSTSAAVLFPRAVFEWWQLMQERFTDDDAQAVAREAFELLKAVCSELTGLRWVDESMLTPLAPLPPVPSPRETPAPARRPGDTRPGRHRPRGML
jgi:hypothetical protein